MNQENQEAEAEAQRDYTPEEIERMRKDTIKFYKDKISVLALQAEHEDLLAKIAEAQLRQVTAIIRRAQLTTAPSEEDIAKQTAFEEKMRADAADEASAHAEESKPRTLKKD
jgi:hypothetical protein